MSLYDASSLSNSFCSSSDMMALNSSSQGNLIRSSGLWIPASPKALPPANAAMMLYVDHRVADHIFLLRRLYPLMILFTSHHFRSCRNSRLGNPISPTNSW